MNEPREYAHNPAPDWLRQREPSESPLAGMRRMQTNPMDHSGNDMKQSAWKERPIKSEFEISFGTAFKFGLAFGMGIALSVPLLVILAVAVLGLTGILVV